MFPFRDTEPLLASQARGFFFSFSFVWFCFFSSRIAADSPEYAACARTSIAGISLDYPFSLSSASDKGCGYPHMTVTRQDKKDLLFLRTSTGLNLTVKDINYLTQTIKLAIDPSLLDGTKECLPRSRNITLFDITNDGYLPFNFSTNSRMGTFFYGCPTEPSSGVQSSYNPSDSLDYNFTSNVILGCSNANSSSYSYAFFDDSFNNAPSGSWSSCQATLSFPVAVSPSSSVARDIGSSLSDGFDLLWTVDSMGDCADCIDSGGRCGHNTTDGSFLCLCRQDSHSGKCNQPDAASPSAPRRSIRWKAIIGLAAAVGSILLAGLLFCFTRSLWVSNGRRSAVENGCFQLHTPAKLEKFLLDYQTLTATRYTYNDIMKMTKKFKHKLGQGGYGSVFQGWLSNGTIVAVKLIEKSYNDGEEFCNEVATIGRIHHVNVVRLLGFCVEGSRKALVYEFMANGSLEKFTSATIAGQYCLSRERLYDIALGIARGIEYLHQGCDRRIIHFDIKPHNILLDPNFTPKISDFGLAKSYCKERSIVTITGGKGTIGYIAPELFYGNVRHASHKSDVYSYGMLLLSIVGMKEKIGPADGSSSEAYFPQWIHDALSKNQKFEGIGEGQDEIIRKMATIALWCIQWNPMDRPGMKEVIMMLEGSTSNLTMPPNHFCPLIQPEYVVQAFDSSSTSEYTGL